MPVIKRGDIQATDIGHGHVLVEPVSGAQSCGCDHPHMCEWHQRKRLQQRIAILEATIAGLRAKLVDMLLRSVDV